MIYQRINDTYTPLLTNGVYRNKVVFLMDKPRGERLLNAFNAFKDANPTLVEGEHLHLLPVEAIEMYYPEPFKKTLEEVDALTEIKQKVNLASEVAATITEEQFRSEMGDIYKMLEKAIDLAYE